MATLVFTALGTAIGGPLGGALGSLIGHQVDRAVFGGGASREGPRLKELAVTTSSYGAALPRHFGTMRAAGTIVWATDIRETRERSGGSKASPSTTKYSYSASFAVALASRPLLGVGRIWADGNLLRGTAGDLKVGGRFRFHSGHGDQAPDPLIAADRPDCPAFRGTAYCVFEDLQLTEFGNRLPALTFELFADEGVVDLADIVTPDDEAVAVQRALPGVTGFTDEGGTLASVLGAIEPLFPFACDAAGDALKLRDTDAPGVLAVALPEPSSDPDEGELGARTGTTLRRLASGGPALAGVRYYDPARDYQLGIQRAGGQAQPGRAAVIDFPAALEAAQARTLVTTAAERARAACETLSWRTAELDPSVAPGTLVQAPGHPGSWLVDAWEWRDSGVELSLRRASRHSPAGGPADPGAALIAVDRMITGTHLVAFELPWDGFGTGEARRVFAAASSASSGWKGAALYADVAGELVPIGAVGPDRSVVGELLTPAPSSSALLLEDGPILDVALVSADFQFHDASPEQLAQGANRALLGTELIQFARAERLGDTNWRLFGLLRGRGGTEAAAQAGHAAGTPFVLLDSSPVALDPALLGSANAIAALGLADEAPVVAQLLNAGATLKPLTPVHPSVAVLADGSRRLCWARRARGAWVWPDAIDAPLNEQAERYVVGVGDVASPAMQWELDFPRLDLAASSFAGLVAEHSGSGVWVRQLGTYASSDPLLLFTLD